jgi:hypothetical protein
MMRTTVATIGGGLAGLYAGRLLRAAGIDFKLSWPASIGRKRCSLVRLSLKLGRQTPLTASADHRSTSDSR